MIHTAQKTKYVTSSTINRWPPRKCSSHHKTYHINYVFTETISLSREQVSVLSNLTMTDYGLQGRTQPDNLVDLSNCKNHQLYYTCLSRSATAVGTIIIQDFDARKITGEASGYLRQEFRELELLDEITKLQYEINCLIIFMELCIT
jgi:hypothetical protein